MFVEEDYQFLSPSIKMYSDKYFHAKKFQCLKLNTLFFNQRREMNVKEVYDYQFLSPFEKCNPTKISRQTTSMFEFEYTFFDQTKEMFVKEDYQFLSISKMYPDK